jgi:hypothetical protein
MRIAAAESYTRLCLLRALNVDEDDEVRLEAIVGELSFRKLRSALIAAFRDDATFGSEERLAALRKIMGRMARLEERRNVLLHSLWNYSRLPDEMLREKRHVGAAGIIRNDSEAFGDLVDLDNVVADLDAVLRDLSEWHVGVYLGLST